MKTLTKKVLATKFALVLAVTSILGVMPPAHAGIPVIDGANLSQNITTAIESVAMTLKQIEQYKTQLEQYENMIQNTMAPVANIWDQATSTMNRLRSSIDTLNHYKTNLGSIDAYLGKFQNTAYYRSSPCYTPSGCTAAQWAEMRESQRLGSEAQKRATDALFRGLDQQQDAMQSDATQLQRLQSSAQSASGQLQAIGYANQLASHQSNQLLQIRGLLIAQQNVIATRNQTLADKEAQEAAAATQFRKGTYRASPPRAW